MSPINENSSHFWKLNQSQEHLEVSYEHFRPLRIRGTVSQPMTFDDDDEADPFTPGGRGLSSTAQGSP